MVYTRPGRGGHVLLAARGHQRSQRRSVGFCLELLARNSSRTGGDSRGCRRRDVRSRKLGTRLRVGCGERYRIVAVRSTDGRAVVGPLRLLRCRESRCGCLGRKSLRRLDRWISARDRCAHRQARLENRHTHRARSESLSLLHYRRTAHCRRPGRNRQRRVRFYRGAWLSLCI